MGLADDWGLGLACSRLIASCLLVGRTTHARKQPNTTSPCLKNSRLLAAALRPAPASLSPPCKLLMRSASESLHALCKPTARFLHPTVSPKSDKQYLSHTPESHPCGIELSSDPSISHGSDKTLLRNECRQGHAYTKDLGPSLTMGYGGGWLHPMPLGVAPSEPRLAKLVLNSDLHALICCWGLSAFL